MVTLGDGASKSAVPEWAPGKHPGRKLNHQFKAATLGYEQGKENTVLQPALKQR